MLPRGTNCTKEQISFGLIIIHTFAMEKEGFQEWFHYSPSKWQQVPVYVSTFVPGEETELGIPGTILCPTYAMECVRAWKRGVGT